jgi:hypothetical protein
MVHVNGVRGKSLDGSAELRGGRPFAAYESAINHIGAGIALSLRSSNDSPITSGDQTGMDEPVWTGSQNAPTRFAELKARIAELASQPAPRPQAVCSLARTDTVRPLASVGACHQDLTSDSPHDARSPVGTGGRTTCQRNLATAVGLQTDRRPRPTPRPRGPSRPTSRRAAGGPSSRAIPYTQGPATGVAGHSWAPPSPGATRDS